MSDRPSAGLDFLPSRVSPNLPTASSPADRVGDHRSGRDVRLGAFARLVVERASADAVSRPYNLKDRIGAMQPDTAVTRLISDVHCAMLSSRRWAVRAAPCAYNPDYR